MKWSTSSMILRCPRLLHVVLGCQHAALTTSTEILQPGGPRGTSVSSLSVELIPSGFSEDYSTGCSISALCWLRHVSAGLLLSESSAASDQCD